MKHANRLTPLLLLVTVMNLACTQTPRTGKEIFFADPTVYPENGKYYLTGTQGDYGPGFKMMVSTDLYTWEPCNHTDSLELRKGTHTFGSKGFWAPQLYKWNDTYHMFYTANVQIAVAKSPDITGPYLQDTIRPIDKTGKNIDPFLFRDDNGQFYLYHVRLVGGNYIYCAAYDMENDTIDLSTLTRCLEQTQEWEHTGYSQTIIMEGPTVFKKDGVYYLFYSANDYRSPDYAVGYATATNPYGPWVKYEFNPIIHRSIVGEVGSGHGDLFQGNDNNLYYVYHTHYSDTVVHNRRTRIVPLVFEHNPDTGRDDIHADARKRIVPLLRQ